MSKDPSIFNQRPIKVIRTLPKLSARLPAPTTNIPQKRAVRLTAILTVPNWPPKDVCNVGMTLSKELAKS